MDKCAREASGQFKMLQYAEWNENMNTGDMESMAKDTENKVNKSTEKTAYNYLESDSESGSINSKSTEHLNTIYQFQYV
jgi:hypothetical protein